MAELEFFNPSEGGEYNAASFEKFKEQIKKNAAFIAAAQKSEQRQKKKEDRLAKILLQFIQRNQKSGILMLAARLLQENIPASFILSIITLGNEELQQELKKEIMADVPQIESGEALRESPSAKMPGEFSLATRLPNASLPLKIRAEIDAWAKSIFEAGSAVPFRVLETVLNKEGTIKQVVIDCAANVLDDYLAANEKPQVPYEACFSFCDFLMKGIMNNLQKQIENQKELS